MGNVSRGRTPRSTPTDHLQQRAQRPSLAQQEREHLDTCANQESQYAQHPRDGYYHSQVRRIYQRLVRPGARVLDVGCGDGSLLASLRPMRGLGVDIVEAHVDSARTRHPDLEFIVADAQRLELREQFDYVLLSDLILDVWDVQQVFRSLYSCCHADTRLILNTYSRLWRGPLTVARRLGLARPRLGNNWLDRNDVENLLYLEGFETIRHSQEILSPGPIPALATICNRYAVRLPLVRHLALCNFVVARPFPERCKRERTVSVICPARNEAGNIQRVIDDTPELGAGTELIFVEGNSTDDTWATIQQAVARHPERKIRFMQQTGRGKADAVRLGFARASGEILMILDADLTVPGEYLQRFYEALQSGRGEFCNGVRLVYPMRQDAMRFFNLAGNKFFALAFSWVLGQPIKDTLCGTKALTREAYANIARHRAYFGDFDPFGDFDLIFGAAKQELKMVDIPVRYQDRDYGETNISRWSSGVLLLRMLLLAARRVKFV